MVAARWVTQRLSVKGPRLFNSSYILYWQPHRGTVAFSPRNIHNTGKSPRPVSQSSPADLAAVIAGMENCSTVRLVSCGPFLLCHGEFSA
ncbi:hypothetical protein VFPPC_18676 [Pochonia chlamydosporia 170]|uniref:Uncharacterized protein n=1 Tax=Pochonia chlamydosporia 170 TaxID=1380566 RepID=A0A219AS96_METCM|nr:hypothetical protein VFPPC_18676 [Pochonia chlamydosporia 170]OWT43597.1 hypothetical protein VFPPC_18676 [Pochonia chlamydosporia 170]